MFIAIIETIYNIIFKLRRTVRKRLILGNSSTMHKNKRTIAETDSKLLNDLSKGRLYFLFQRFLEL